MDTNDDDESHEIPESDLSTDKLFFKETETHSKSIAAYTYVNLNESTLDVCDKLVELHDVKLFSEGEGGPEVS